MSVSFCRFLDGESFRLLAIFSFFLFLGVFSPHLTAIGLGF
jgi:hypothetical protein